MRKGVLEVVEEDPESGDERTLRALGRGESFGELGLVSNAPRAATVRAVDRVELFEVDKSSFDRLLADRISELAIDRAQLGRELPGDWQQRPIAALELQQSLRSTFMTIVSFHEVDFTYDRKFLVESFEDHRKQMKGLIAKHLSDKSGERIDNFMDMFANPGYLDFLYGSLKSGGNPKANDDIAAVRQEMISGFKGLLEWFHL